jgi:hypothetical protein
MLKACTLFILFFLTIFSEKSNAQADSLRSPFSSTTFGVLAGLGQMHFSGRNTNGEKFGGENLLRFRGGANMDIPLSAFVSIRPELLFSMGGYKTKDSLKTDLSYLKIPSSIVFKLLNLPSENSIADVLSIGIGSYFAYAIDGRLMDNSSSSMVKFANRDVSSTTLGYADYFKRWDTGINAFLEFTGTNFYSQIGSSIGLTNIKPRLDNPGAHQANCKNASINLSYGWRF